MDITLLVTLLALLSDALAESEKGLLDPSSEEEVEPEKKITGLDMSGTIRKRFGIVAAMQDVHTSSVCSPVAALFPLGKLALGAEGSTLKELYEAMGISVESGEDDYIDSYHSDYTTIKHHISGLIKELRNVTRPFLDVASRLYVSEKKKLYQIFKKQSESIFKSAVKKVDFDSPINLYKTINGWVSSQTHEVINDIVSPSDQVSPDTSLFVVNAIYFTSTWETSFSQPRTGEFNGWKGEMQLFMMQSKAWYNYASSKKLDAQLVEIPYAQPNMSMLLVVPQNIHGLSGLLKLLNGNPGHLTEAIEQMTKALVILNMPTFRIESQWNLKTLYQEVGLENIFKTKKSGLTGIVRNEDLHVSTAIQKAVIDVHDKGKHPYVDFTLTPDTMGELIIAEHPFLFYVRLKSQPLLMGTCC